MRWRLVQETSGNDCTAIGPSSVESSSTAGLRTATAHVVMPRIITPSSTACPPTGASREAVRRPPPAPAPISCNPGLSARAGGRTRSAATLGHAPLEALNATTGVDQLLLARIERVAGRADLDVNLVLRRAGHELVAARAADVSVYVFGMNFGLHCTDECSVAPAVEEHVTLSELLARS